MSEPASVQAAGTPAVRSGAAAFIFVTICSTCSRSA
jgi:hypothetical protein